MIFSKFMGEFVIVNDAKIPTRRHCEAIYRQSNQLCDKVRILMQICTQKKHFVCNGLLRYARNDRLPLYKNYLNFNTFLEKSLKFAHKVCYNAKNLLLRGTNVVRCEKHAFCVHRLAG